MTSSEWIPIIVAVIGLLGSGYAVLAGREGRRSDAASKITGSALQLYEQAQERIGELETKLEKERVARKKDVADEQVSRATAVAQIMRELEDEREKRRQLQSQVFEYRAGIMMIIIQLTEAGIKPQWTPPDWELGLDE